MTDNMTIAERISDARMGCGMTLSNAAKRLGVKAETLREWENGHRSPRANKLQMLAGIYNVPLIWLLEGRSDLDPLQNTPSDLEVIEARLQHITMLQTELSTALSELSSEIAELKQKNTTLDRLAEESLHDLEFRKAG